MIKSNMFQNSLMKDFSPFIKKPYANIFAITSKVKKAIVTSSIIDKTLLVLDKGLSTGESNAS